MVPPSMTSGCKNAATGNVCSCVPVCLSLLNIGMGATWEGRREQDAFRPLLSPSCRHIPVLRFKHSTPVFFDFGISSQAKSVTFWRSLNFQQCKVDLTEIQVTFAHLSLAKSVVVQCYPFVLKQRSAMLHQRWFLIHIDTCRASIRYVPRATSKLIKPLRCLVIVARGKATVHSRPALPKETYSEKSRKKSSPMALRAGTATGPNKRRETRRPTHR